MEEKRSKGGHGGYPHIIVRFCLCLFISASVCLLAGLFVRLSMYRLGVLSVFW